MRSIFERLRRHRRWLDPLLVILVMWPVVQLMTAVAESPSVKVDVCAWRGDIPAEVLQQTVPVNGRCSLVGRTVYSGNAAIIVPPAGYSVGGAGAKGSGAGQALDMVVATSVSGDVSVTLEGPPPAVAARRASETKAQRCSDAAYYLGDGVMKKWNAPLVWSFNAGTTPKHLKAAKALTEIRKAAVTVATQQNSCGQPMGGVAPQTYAGTTAALPDVDLVGNAVTCGEYNTENTVAFGELPSGLFGWTCYWWDQDGNMVGADMTLTTSPDLVTKFPKDLKACRNQWDLKTIATHEWGHAFGLGHVAASSRYLTMPPLLLACDTTQGTLGLGDYQGMRTLYG